MPIPVQCSNCEAILKLKDDAEETLGKKMQCPKCGEAFVAKRYQAPDSDDEVDDFVFADEEPDEDEYSDRPRRSASRSAGDTSRSSASKSKNAAPANNTTMKTVMSIVSAVVVLLGIGLRVWLRNRAPAPQQFAAGGLAPNAAFPGAPIAVISDAEYEDYAHNLERKIVQQNGQALTSSMNLHKLIDRSVQGLELSPQFLTGFRSGVGGSFAQSFATQLDKTLADNGHYRFVRLHGDVGKKRLLFRMVGISGINYHDLELERAPTGQLEIVDMHISLSSEMLSETLRRMTVLAAVGQKGSFLKSLTGQLSEFEKSMPLIDQFHSLKNAGQFAQSLAAYKQLPPSIQKEKTFALSRAMVALQVNEQEYFAALSDFRKEFPTDACIDFMSVDFFLLKKDFEQAHAALDRFDKSLGGDSYLNALRANLFAEQKKWDEAKQAIALAIEAEPTLANLVTMQAGIGLVQPDYKLLLQSMLTLKNRHNFQFEGIATNPEYAGFVESPEYQEWLKSN